MLISMISKTAAQLVSFVLGPLIWIPLLLTIFVLKTNLSSNQIFLLLPLLIILQVFFPFLYILIAYKLKKISDLDLSKREERIIPMVIIFISLFISLFVVKSFNSTILYRFYLFSILVLAVNGFITLFWKISFHMGINIVGSLLINFLYHWQLPILYLTIPLVFWSRLKLKRHTPAQLIAALLLNTVIVFLFLKHYNYL